MTERKWLAIPGSSDRLVLLAYDDGPARFANLSRRRKDDSEAWNAEPPEKQDAWVDVETDGDVVVASSWSCWRVTLAADSGRELSRVFTK